MERSGTPPNHVAPSSRPSVNGHAHQGKLAHSGPLSWALITQVQERSALPDQTPAPSAILSTFPRRSNSLKDVGSRLEIESDGHMRYSQRLFCMGT